MDDISSGFEQGGFATPSGMRRMIVELGMRSLRYVDAIGVREDVPGVGEVRIVGGLIEVGTMDDRIPVGVTILSPEGDPPESVRVFVSIEGSLQDVTAELPDDLLDDEQTNRSTMWDPMQTYAYVMGASYTPDVSSRAAESVRIFPELYGLTPPEEVV